VASGHDQGTPEWIAQNVDGIVATMEWLYAVAAETDTLGAIEFLYRMVWLSTLVAELDRDALRPDG
jgi:hypothetical protein